MNFGDSYATWIGRSIENPSFACSFRFTFATKNFMFCRM